MAVAQPSVTMKPRRPATHCEAARGLLQHYRCQLLEGCAQLLQRRGTAADSAKPWLFAVSLLQGFHRLAVARISAAAAALPWAVAAVLLKHCAEVAHGIG